MHERKLLRGRFSNCTKSLKVGKPERVGVGYEDSLSRGEGSRHRERAERRSLAAAARISSPGTYKLFRSGEQRKTQAKQNKEFNVGILNIFYEKKSLNASEESVGREDFLPNFAFYWNFRVVYCVHYKSGI